MADPVRHAAPAAYNGLKTAWRLLVHDLGGVEAAAAASRVASKSTISDYGNLHTDRFVPVDIVLDAEMLAGHARDVSALFADAATALAHAAPTENERARLAADLDDVARVATETRARLLSPPTGVDRCRSIPRQA